MHVLNAIGQRKQTPGFPVGAIVAWFTSAGTPIPVGWAICDGAGGTPDLTDRVLVGATAVGTPTLSGATSPTSGAPHSGGAAAMHSDHVITQPSGHSNHVVTQPSGHSAHTVTQPSAHGTHATGGAHTHDAHSTEARTAAGLQTEATSPVTHSSDGGHAHDAHSAHAGTAVDAHSAHAGTAVDAHSAHAGANLDAHSAHSMTQADDHAIYKNISLVYLIKVAA